MKNAFLNLLTKLNLSTQAQVLIWQALKVGGWAFLSAILPYLAAISENNPDYMWISIPLNMGLYAMRLYGDKSKIEHKAKELEQ